MRALAGIAAAVALAGCGSAENRPAPPTPPTDAAGVRPLGPGPRFQPKLGRQAVRDCRPRLGRRVGVHLELFARRFVVIFPAGIGTRPPRRMFGGRIERARCYGPLVTIDPTGLVLVRPGVRATVGDLFAQWGRALRAGFAGRLRAWVDGREAGGDPAAIPLRRHAEIVLEVGGFVPPHHAYTFPSGF
jgi:hypothetical protein